MALTKNHIVKTLHKRLDLPRNTAVEVVDSLLEIMKKTLEDGEDVLISGFGRFCVKEKKERRGRNPVTGNDLILRARRVVSFRCSGVLRDKINRGALPGA